jgi:hypothetical protein
MSMSMAREIKVWGFFVVVLLLFILGWMETRGRVRGKGMGYGDLLLLIGLVVGACACCVGVSVGRECDSSVGEEKKAGGERGEEGRGERGMG